MDWMGLGFKKGREEREGRGGMDRVGFSGGLGIVD